MALTAATKTQLYQFFAIAFDAAPGVTYMSQLTDAANAGMSVQQIVEVFTTKPQFTSVYPNFFTNEQFATKLVDNVVGDSASAAAKAEAVADIEAALSAGWSRGKVIYQVFSNLAAKDYADPTWGGTAKLMHNQVVVAQYVTEHQLFDTTDLAKLQAAIAHVTANTDVSSDAAIEAVIGGVTSKTFTLTPSSGSVDEGSHDLISLHTTNVAAGTVLTYNITGIDANRLSTGATGQVTVDANGNATIDLGVIANDHTDGATTARVSLANGKAFADVVVNDTSTTPPQKLTTSATDVIDAQATNMVILGQLTDSFQPTQANTLHASDVIHGNAAFQNLLKVTADGVDPTVVGFTMDGVQTLEVDSYANGAVTLGLVNVEGLQHVRSTNSTGDINLTYVQNIVDLDLTGTGGTAADGIDVQVSYAADAVNPAAGGAQTQAINLNHFGGNITVGDVNHNGITDVDVTTAGRSSDITLDSDELQALHIAGTADLTVAVTGTDQLSEVGAANFGANLHLDADMITDGSVTSGVGNDTLHLSVTGNGVFTVDAGAGDNQVDVVEHGAVSAINVVAGAGADDIVVSSLEYAQTNVTINAGAGNNQVTVDTNNWNGEANHVSVTTLGGNDVVTVGDAAALTVDAGNGHNDINVGNIYGAASITGGADEDHVAINSVDDGALTVALAAGDNALYAGSVVNATVTAADGSNLVAFGDLDTNAAVSVTLGQGDNTVVFDHADSGGADIHITAGNGNNTIDLLGSDGGFYGYTSGEGSNQDQLHVSLGNGDNTVKLGYGGLELNTDWAPTTAGGYTIAAGTGHNTIEATTIDTIDDEGTFANISNFQTLVIGADGNDVSGSFDGVATGANKTGIVNYVLNGEIDNDLYLTNVNNNVTVDVNGGTDHTWGYGNELVLSIASDNVAPLSIAPVAATTEATVNFNVNEYDVYTYGSHSQDNVVAFDNVGTLNLNASYEPVSGGSDANDAYVRLHNVVAENTTTLNIAGNAAVEITTGSGSADVANLSLVDSTALTGDLYLSLYDNVHPAGGITINTGIGDDRIDTGYGKVTINAGEGNNSVHADSGGGDVTVTAGNGANHVVVGNSVGNFTDTVTLGNGGNKVTSYSANSVIKTGSGNDEVYVSNANLSKVNVGGGKNEIHFEYADQLTAGDVLTGGTATGDWTKLVIDSGTLGTQYDSFFRQWSGVQELDLADGGNNLTLNWIAYHDADLQKVVLSATGGGDTLNLGNEFLGPLEVVLGNGNDTINVAAAVNQFTGPKQLDVDANDYQLTSGDQLNGGHGSNDVLHIQATGSNADLRALDGGFEHVTINAGEGQSTSLYASDASVNNGQALEINASAMANSYDGDGNLQQLSNFAFSVSGGGDYTNTTSNDFTIKGGAGNNSIWLYNNTGDTSIDLTGSVAAAGNHVWVGGADGNSSTVTVGDSSNCIWSAAEDSNTITGGNGSNEVWVGATSGEGGISNDSVTLGNGSNWVSAGGASVTVKVGNGVNYIWATNGADSITVGTGSNYIDGNNGGDTITLGAANAVGRGVNHIYYGSVQDSFGTSLDSITGFKVGVNGDVIDLSGVLAEAVDGGHVTGVAQGGGITTYDVNFVGVVKNAAFAGTALASVDHSHLNVVFDASDNALIVDADGSGTISNGDLTIELVGITSGSGSSITSGFAAANIAADQIVHNLT